MRKDNNKTNIFSLLQEIAFSSTRKLCLIFLFIALSNRGFSQLASYNYGNILFNQSQSINNHLLIDSTSQLSFGNQALANTFGKIRKTYFSYHFKEKEHKQTNSKVGFDIENNKNGEIINLVRAQIHYSQNVKLSKDVTLAVGTELGLINLRFESTPNTMGGSDIKADWDLMIALKSKTEKLGVSINHLTNPHLILITEQINIPRHLSIFGEKHIALNSYSTLGIAHESTFITNSHYISRSMVGYHLKDALHLGLGITNGAITSTFGISNIESGKINVEIAAGYQFSTTLAGNIGYDLLQFQLKIEKK